ncbi:pentatricopeptide repeat-containing protein At2g26790, mitochondrial-like [Rhododendron vialii]|uniref:pentatricopeptide repeat-containing protein At2g26790, mitochondrial-like n=1 Tax=Rhododendron vialii TaxID=182163 RepID=UPI00265F6453|nr:pentatricopeptide repeat-containing protein At2g26790, mitochondrial-like [Rhododendron vialii]
MAWVMLWGNWILARLLKNSLREEPCHALSFFDQLKEQGFVHNVSTYMAIIRILCYWGMATRLDSILLGVFKSNDQHLGFKVSDLFEALIERIEAKGPESLIRAFDALVKAYVSIGNFDDRLIESGKNDRAVAVFWQFKQLGLSPNNYSYCIVIKALCRKGSLDEAADIFQEMEEAGLTPNAFTNTTYIERLCSQTRSDFGYEVLKAWREQNIPIDVFTYLVVIRGFVNESKLKEAECMLLDMDEHGVVPDAYCCRSLICGYCKIGHILKALALHNEMAAKCIKSSKPIA